MTTPVVRNNRDCLETGRRLARCEPGDEVVITGISGVFPDSDNVKHFGENLLAKKDLITDDDRRWKLEHPEIPRRTGKLNVLNKFDAAFFGVGYKHAQSMDPMSRIFLEKVYEAIVDAGYNPKQLQGSNTGVFVGACYSESEKVWLDEKMEIEGFAVTGCSRAMTANRVSYWLDVNGPSYAIDTACSSSLCAIEHAYKALRDNICDAAIVGGCNLCLHPYFSLQFARLGVISKDGKCRSFDDSANGYGRSEAVVAVFLQKMSDARRVYARIEHAKVNCDGYKEQGITYPSSPMQRRLLQEFYDECQIHPNTVDFIEAHGTATWVGDLQELKSLYEVFCRDRNTPLKIGSVKSNMGHSEPASGLCSIAKVILAFELGIIPPNINLEKLRSNVQAFREGKITVVTEPVQWEGGLAGINNFGFGGVNCHVLLSSNQKTKVNYAVPSDDLPRLACISGRTEEAVDVVLTELESRSVDVELIRLFHEVHSDDITGHVYRGYTLLKKNNTEEVIRHIEYFSGEKRQLWFIFSGMGSQWLRMGKDMMKIPVFFDSIKKSHETLKPKNVNLIEIISISDQKIFSNILNCFVGIAAIQIALVDLLYAIGLKPNGIIGHSVGELGCAYADGCFTAEQTILAAYFRGLVSTQSNFIPGSMASIGLGYNTIKPLVPSDIDIACHNSSNNCTISGPSQSVNNFVTSLQQKDIFAREVNVCNIAYHSRYIADAAPRLLSHLNDVIPEPKLRSKKWISSSWLQSDWNDEKAKYSSAEYHTNNLLNPVYFEEASRCIPSNAIVIEIAPHGLLQAILKRSLNKHTTNISLMSKHHADSCVEFFFTALGKIYEAGANFRIQNLYPPVGFPVSRGTPMIAPLVRWEHSNDWFVPSFRDFGEIKSGERTVTVTLKDNNFKYLSGHIINGRNLYPATGYLLLAWETLSLLKGKLYSEVSVVFENVRFNRATNIPQKGGIEFTVMVQKGSGNFEVVEAGVAVVTGRIYIPDDIDKESLNLSPLQDHNNSQKNFLPLSKEDIYKELKLRGYNYKDLFKGITYCDSEGNHGRIAWKDNFVCFMDNMLQMRILKEDTRSLFVPVAVKKIVINCEKHFSILHYLDKLNPEFDAYVYKEIDLISCGGIEIRNLRAEPIPKRKILEEPVLEKFQFVSHTNNEQLDFKNAITVACHLALENLSSPASMKIKVAELIDHFSKPEAPLVSQILLDVLGNLPLVQADVVVLADSKHPLFIMQNIAGITVQDGSLPKDQSCSIIIASRILNRKEDLQDAFYSLKQRGFLLTREAVDEELIIDSFNFDVCFDYIIHDERILLIRESIKMSTTPLVIRILGETYSWVPEVQKALSSLNLETNQKLLLFAEKEAYNGILGFFNCLLKELNGNNVRCFYIMDNDAPNFSLQHPMYRTQFAKDLAVNVYKNGKWGSYRHLLLEKISDVEVPHAYVSSVSFGDLTSLKWIEGPLKSFKYYNKPKSMLIHVYYSSLNFRDIMLATGRISIDKNRLDQEYFVGFEYAGKADDGERYMGITTTKALASLIESDLDFQWKVPHHWSLEDAATIPVVYATVLYAFRIGHLKKSDKILIHAGSGGIGQAAINLCLFYGCEIFTTVGNADKKKFIRETFPQIPGSHIGNSRDTSFEQMIMKETNGSGVDVVLNSLAEEKLMASVRCLGGGGRFLEIGKFDIMKNNNLEMEHFLKGISFHGVMLDRLFTSVHREEVLELKETLQKCIEEGAVKPLIRTVFAFNEVEAAFRFMATGKHIGKVMLKIRDEEADIHTKPKTLLFKAIPRYLCSNDGSYIICGGLGGFGLELADWLIIRGARNLILTSRKGITTGYQSMKVKMWQSYGINVIISTEDITKVDGIQKILQTANSLGPVSAIFNLAAVLRDAMFENQTEESFAISAAPKGTATHLLDQLSRKMCPMLEHFVVFSSVSCGRGNTGQTNYGMSNSVMERICEARKLENLPALAVQWGAIGDVGLVADMTGDDPEVIFGGTLLQKIESCLEVLGHLMKQPNPIVSSMVIAEKVSHKAGTIRKSAMDTVAGLLGLRDWKTVSSHSSLAELGMDSMMLVEMKQLLEREFHIFLTPQEIRKLTFDKLQELTVTNENNNIEKETRKKKNEMIEVTDQTNLDYFMRLVGDEEQAVKPIVRLPSLANEGSTEELSTDTCPTVFVIPGIEGIAKMMEPLSVHLNVQVLCLQFDFEDPPKTLEGLAENLLVHITSRLSRNQEFLIIGYSFGGIVAMEIVKMLEENGRTGRLWLIDSSPEFLRLLVKSIFELDNEAEIENELQVKVILRYLDIFWPKVSRDVCNQLYKLADWQSRIELVASLPFPEIQHNKHYQCMIINAAYYRIKSLLEYTGMFKNALKAPTTLIRPTESLLHLEKYVTYGLSKLCSSPVDIRFVEGNHFTILENEKTADIINKEIIFLS